MDLTCLRPASPLSPARPCQAVPRRPSVAPVRSESLLSPPTPGNLDASRTPGESNVFLGTEGPSGTQTHSLRDDVTRAAGLFVRTPSLPVRPLRQQTRAPTLSSASALLRPGALNKILLNPHSASSTFLSASLTAPTVPRMRRSSVQPGTTLCRPATSNDQLITHHGPSEHADRLEQANTRDV